MLLFLSTTNESSALSWMLKCSVEIKFYHLFRVLLRVNLLVFYSYLSCTFNLLTCYIFFFFSQWWNNRTNITREKETWKTTKEEKAGRFTKVNKTKTRKTLLSVLTGQRHRRLDLGMCCADELVCFPCENDTRPGFDDLGLHVLCSQSVVDLTFILLLDPKCNKWLMEYFLSTLSLTIFSPCV